jgi:hypothetical protein
VSLDAEFFMTFAVDIGDVQILADETARSRVTLAFLDAISALCIDQASPIDTTTPSTVVDMSLS